MALGMSNEDYIPEEGYDILRDMGKIPPTKDKKDATTMPPSKEWKRHGRCTKAHLHLNLSKRNMAKPSWLLERSKTI